MFNTSYLKYYNFLILIQLSEVSYKTNHFILYNALYFIMEYKAYSYKMEYITTQNQH